MSSWNASETTIKADVETVFDALAREMGSFAANFEVGDLRTVWREEAAWLTLHTMKKVRGTR
ncbi:hypothetical protein [Streptomyces liangshanensis]|uniref:hypothetical protein n=1 Tax=Streptomyces liangshanensis TaxID=2717324 RepID=UPI0036D99EE0